MFGLGKKKEKAPKEEWDGNGDSVWANIKRWYYTRFKGYVVLREFDTRWDASSPKDDDNPPPFDCDLRHRLIKKKDLPEEAVHCTGEPYVFSVDRACIRYGFHDNGFRATDAWLYLEFGGFDDCLTKKWTSMDHISTTKVLVIAGIVIAVLIAVVIVRLN